MKNRSRPETDSSRHSAKPSAGLVSGEWNDMILIRTYRYLFYRLYHLDIQDRPKGIGGVEVLEVADGLDLGVGE